MLIYNHLEPRTEFYDQGKIQLRKTTREEIAAQP